MTASLSNRLAVSESNRRRAAARATERLAKPVVVDGSLIAQAKAERGTGVPLVTESLEEKLERHLPGATATLERNGWWIRRGAKVLLVGAVSQREAVDLAVTLWGSR